MLPVSVFGAVDAAPSHEAGEVGDRDPEYLLGEDVIYPLLEVDDLALKPLNQAARDLPKEHARFGDRIEERDGGVAPDVRAVSRFRPRFSQGIQHPVGELRRSNPLVVREVRDAGQDIRVATP